MECTRAAVSRFAASCGPRTLTIVFPRFRYGKLCILHRRNGAAAESAAEPATADNELPAEQRELSAARASNDAGDSHGLQTPCSPI